MSTVVVDTSKLSLFAQKALMLDALTGIPAVDQVRILAAAIVDTVQRIDRRPIDDKVTFGVILGAQADAVASARALAFHASVAISLAAGAKAAREPPVPARAEPTQADQTE